MHRFLLLLPSPQTYFQPQMVTITPPLWADGDKEGTPSLDQLMLVR